MNDLRKAAEMALKVLETTWGDGSEYALEEWKETIQALRQALNVDAVNMSQERVDETAKREHEPLVWMNKYGHVASFQNEEYKDPLYTAPPKKEWVGMSEEEAWSCWDWEDFQRTWKSMEDKLKEKNG